MMKRKKIGKILLIILGVILVLGTVAALVLPKLVAKLAYDDNFGGRFTTYQPLAWKLEDFEGLMREKYTFASDKGQMLTGYKYYKDNVETKGVMVIAHGFGGGGHRSYMNVADYFTSNGYAVFAYDATGNDESEGEAVGGLPQGIIDLDYALRFVKSSPEFSEFPIVLWGGYSVGTVLKLHPDVKAAAIVAGFDTSLDMLEVVGGRIVGAAIGFVLPHFEAHEKEMFGEYASMSVFEGLEATDASVMFVHSVDDDMIPIEISFDRYYEKYADDNRFTFIRYEDRGHNYVFCSENRKEYVEEYNLAEEAYRERVGEMTEEMVAAYYEENLDKHKAFPVDDELMSQILELYNSNLN